MNEQLQLTDEILGAWLDGELPAAQREAVRLALEADPGAQARVERLRTLDARLRQAFALPQTQKPDPLAALLLAAPDEAAVPGGGQRRPRRHRAGLRWALAASLALAVLGGLLSLRLKSPAESLQLALEQLPSGQQRDDAGVRTRPILSFRADDGRWCRMFEQSGKSGTLEGLACRQDGRWQILAQARGAADALDFRAAGGDGGLDAEMNRLGQAPTLEAAAERSLIAQGWPVK
ncbi:hypothetical protein SAMN04488038_101453 [Solimonas aquatica]|uniref:Anti-sigma factor n=1 Tax=Solimonas aquatica TaxID=489703 RepID=A0A1H9AM72_9GAMM|nr:hypothetical protein [Solimonas aquatica]SEP77665.1 hypothetical protein SAMN04488038_101453 [Solimonas aquatica]